MSREIEDLNTRRHLKTLLKKGFSLKKLVKKIPIRSVLIIVVIKNHFEHILRNPNR